MKIKNNLNVIIITKKARSQIQNLLYNKFIGIKLNIKNSGCMGLKYELKFVKKKCKNYVLFNIKKINIFVKKKIIPLIYGIKIDFIKEGLNKKFNFINPQAKNVCGCGSSFNNIT
ncbi:Iron-binding protein IscA [Candidatus Annandia adelgestsuga]|uniref:Iron-binding protein IscA n=1 Tax=Candidatus Annandia adelgestsuga TaxID=1302411 RepID=A0A3S5HNY4_9ENTR|nr:iron-sulfur cluster assembly accessory protein [Candidatus Annandia adelgestsuga]AZP36396.1 Iron-binding protein IscA [Candidatus Annandia adelgestsuga]